MISIRHRNKRTCFLTLATLSLLAYWTFLQSTLPIRRFENVIDSVCEGVERNFSCPSHKDKNVKFYLHTNKNPDAYALETGDEENLKNSSFLKGVKLKILIHGWKVSSEGEFCTNTRKAYLTQNEVDGINVIIIDWKEAAGFDGYIESAECTRAIAKKTSKLIQFLLNYNLVTLDLIHVVGHSLGAHIAAMACSSLNYVGGCGRITALDPARPCFRPKDCPLEFRLDPSDAQFIDVIHTDGSSGENYGFGYEGPLGHVDFYPNGGRRPQPGCGNGILDGCSHSRAHELFTESVNNPAGFLARHCGSWSDFLRNKCKDSSSVIMGEHTRVHRGQRIHSTYYLNTVGTMPFALGLSGADPLAS